RSTLVPRQAGGGVRQSRLAGAGLGFDGQPLPPVAGHAAAKPGQWHEVADERLQPRMEPGAATPGPVFQGRYRSVPVNGTDADAWYSRIAADYIHLNPARAGIAGGNRSPVADYRWSSLAAYAKGKGPEWLVMNRVLAAFELSQDGRGRRA